MNDFFAALFELGGNLMPIPADAYYDMFIYQTVGISMLVLCTLFCVLFYYFINSPHFSRIKHWTYMLFAPAIITFLIAWIYPMMKFNYEGIGEDFLIMDLLTMPLIAFILSLITFLLLSISIKWGSTNCKTTPF